MGQINLLYVYVCGGGGEGGKNLVGEHGFPWCRDRGGVTPTSQKFLLPPPPETIPPVDFAPPKCNPPGIPTGIENMAGGGGGWDASSKFDGGLKSVHGRSMGGLKCWHKRSEKEFI